MQTTANLWEALCRDLESERQSAKAEQYHEIATRFLQSARQILRAGSPRLCDAIEIAGDVSQAAGRYADAVANFQEALEKSLALGVPASSARLAAKLAFLHDHLRDPDKARAYFEQSLSLYEQGQDHSQHAMLLNQLGALCKREGDFPAAEAYYQRAMEVARNLHGETHPEVATAVNNLGVVSMELHDFVRAENLHMEALALREKCYGAMHPEVAQSMANLAAVYHAAHEFDKARAFYSGALKIYKRFRRADDPEMQTVQENYDNLLRRVE
ncbi:MAG TPA: tetratricopeptide repeat protein [Terrimicrobiaceae bacterium]|nr:tetratricopeptide repeat protein [Terrimicrobiaceae bacterium]